MRKDGIGFNLASSNIVEAWLKQTILMELRRFPGRGHYVPAVQRRYCRILRPFTELIMKEWPFTNVQCTVAKPLNSSRIS